MKNFKALFVIPKEVPHQVATAQALIEGFKRHGILDAKIVKNFNPATMRADLIAMWAWRPKRTGAHWYHIHKAQQASGGHSLVMERAYLGERHTWTSLGYDGLNGRGDFCNANIRNPGRFNKHFSDLLKPWQTKKTNRVLVAGQCKFDAAVSHINIEDWYRNVTLELSLRGYDVIFREHPLNVANRWNFSGLPVTLDTSASFEESMQSVDCVVTYNSNGGVLSTLAGIPTISHDIGSMVHNVTKHDLKDLNYQPDRKDWAAKISYAQWLPSEMESGEAWAHLKQKYK